MENILDEYPDANGLLKFIKQTIGEMILAIGDYEDRSSEVDADLLVKIEKIEEALDTVNNICGNTDGQIGNTDDQIVEESKASINKPENTLESRIIHDQWVETPRGYFRVADISALISRDITIDDQPDDSCYLVLRSGKQYWVRKEDKELLLNLIKNNVTTTN